MKLFKLSGHAVVRFQQQEYTWPEPHWDELINRSHLRDYLEHKIAKLSPQKAPSDHWLAPAGSQEIWASGVTYQRSKEARMEESKSSGGDQFYDLVYDAERPELFFKAAPGRVVGPGDRVFIRKDSHWDVPEPELTLFVNSHGEIQAYTVGNDMSSRSIEGENPLYLPQAKVYENSAAIGPCLLVPDQPLDPQTEIHMKIYRDSKCMYEDRVMIKQMKRTLEELVSFLFRECTFDKGVFLMTGTCLVPPDTFTLQVGDEVFISIDGIGTLNNQVGQLT